jgi:hypothetical protein
MNSIHQIENIGLFFKKTPRQPCLGQMLEGAIATS